MESNETLKEICRSAELRLDAQLKLATNADQRLLTLSGINATLAAAALAAGAAFAQQNAADLVVNGFLIYAAIQLVATIISVMGAAAKAIHPPGVDPMVWDKLDQEPTRLEMYNSILDVYLEAHKWNREAQNSRRTAGIYSILFLTTSTIFLFCIILYWILVS